MTLLKLSRNNTSALDEATMRRVLGKAKAVVLALLGRTSRRMQIASGLIAFVYGIKTSDMLEEAKDW
jgi:hypothetical protein